MLQLIPFELEKIWKRRSFALSVSVLLLIHVFLLWYTTLPNEETPPLSAYRALQTELRGMSEAEKSEYIVDLKNTVDGVDFVRNILAMQSFGNEMGNELAEIELESNPGVFDAYYEICQSGSYLKYTDSPEQEETLVNEVYEEWQKVAGYGDYLRGIQENAGTLAGISVFGTQDNGGYSARNLKKSAADYEGLDDSCIRFAPSFGITSAMENLWTELLLFLSVLLFVGSLITEEKEKRLFLITRSTKRGIGSSIKAKLAALMIHCIAVTALFYTVSIVFFGWSSGWCDLGASLQSLAPYTESSLSVSIFSYLLLSVLTKALVLFGVGALLTAFCIGSGITVIPFLAGSAFAGISMLMYTFLPAGSFFSAFKYLNPVGLMKTENLYGGYLNFNLFGYPVSRLTLSAACILLIAAAGIACSTGLFTRAQGLEVRKLNLPFRLPFAPHTNIWRHEGYKILMTNRAAAILLLFAALLAWKSFDRTYTPSAGEQYYRSVMDQLEGGLTDEKEELILAEQARYEEAFRKIEQLDELVSAGEMSEDAADALKYREYITVSFYPYFLRVEEQYRKIKESGGSFVYDTGYLYLLGAAENVFSTDFLILSVGVILAVSGVVCMEYDSGALFLIGATKTGRRGVFKRKFLLSAALSLALTLVPIVCRGVHIASVYPMRSLSAPVQSIPYFSGAAVPLSICDFLIIFVLSQLAASAAVTAVTLALAVWRKNQAQTVFFALLILTVPLILALLGFDAAKWFSAYPIYAWTGIL